MEETNMCFYNPAKQIRISIGFPCRLFITKMAISIFVIFATLLSFAQSENNNKSSADQKLVDSYIKSLGYSSYIVFDASNIKQFWTNKTVLSKNGVIHIALRGSETPASELFKIQLANVSQAQDCKIDVLTENPEISFSVLNSKSKVLATSSLGDDFIHYHVASALFHLDDSIDFSFNLRFSAKGTDSLSINKIVLSFSDNKNSLFFGSPDFDALLQFFKEKGIAVDNSDVQYLLFKDQNKIFFKIPTSVINSGLFFCHIVPADEKNFLPERKEVGFNNNDAFVNNPALIMLKPLSTDPAYSIMLCPLPSYPWTVFRVGQHGNGKRLWTCEIKNAANPDKP